MINRKAFYITLLLATFFAHAGIAQELERCVTMEMDSLSRVKTPERRSLEEFEKFISYKISELKARDAAGRTKAGIIKIPIVVHIVHNGEAIGSGTNLSRAQVEAQIEVLNEDFRRKPGTPGFNDNSAGADIEIEFCLSTVDEQGNQLAEPGIHRYDGNRADWTRDEIENNLKPKTIWDPNKFYNIWTVKFSAEDGGLIGYAQFPDQSGLPGLNEEGGPATTDGVVIRYQSFGSVDKGNFPVMQAPYNRGRTLTHETGHWLGLRHIWGDGNCADDFVSDTPPASGPSSGCPIGRQSCGSINMVQNYMDYSDDACMNIFTKGQKTRMLAVMEVSPRRKTLTQNNFCGLTVVQAPEADFTIDEQTCILLGSEVAFTDLSRNFPTEWLWTFEGADPSTSTEKNPRVKYNTAGTFDVQLIVTNELGKDTLLIEDYITVTSEGLCRAFTNFDDSYTRTVLQMSEFTDDTGYLTGHNSAGTRAVSEYFSNDCGYRYISGASVRFGELDVESEDTRVMITVWNARGPQNSPGAVIERKEVLAKQILDDIVNDRPTTITFDRETPVFSRPFHVGVEFDYTNGSELAVISSANGEATTATSWVKHADGDWELFTIAYGANIALDITADVGMLPSVQVSASKVLIYPGEEVTLNGRGASIFTWTSTDGEFSNFPGPQITVSPEQTTTYTTKGSGLELCHNEATTTIYVREEIVAVEEDPSMSLSIFPNPAGKSVNVSMTHPYHGEIEWTIVDQVGRTLLVRYNYKSAPLLEEEFDVSGFAAGVYAVRVRYGNQEVVKTLFKQN